LAVNFPVRQAALEQFHDRPTIRHGLQLSRRAKVAEEAAAFLDAAQREDRGAKSTLVLLFLSLCHGPIGFHQRFKGFNPFLVMY
jgi:hypothetical protein